MDPEFHKSFQNVNRWFSAMVSQPDFKAVTVEITLATRMTQSEAKKDAELHGGQGDLKNTGESLSDQAMSDYEPCRFKTSVL